MCKDALADQLKMTTEQVDAMCAWWEARRKREKEQQVVDVRCEMDSTTLENDDEEQHSIAGNGIFPQSTSGKSDGDLISCIESENSGHHGYYVSAREDVDMGAAEAIKAKVEALPLEVRTNPRQGNVGLKYAVRKFINERCVSVKLCTPRSSRDPAVPYPQII